jgi:hypothetical protein
MSRDRGPDALGRNGTQEKPRSAHLLSRIQITAREGFAKESHRMTTRAFFRNPEWSANVIAARPTQNDPSSDPLCDFKLPPTSICPMSPQARTRNGRLVEVGKVAAPPVPTFEWQSNRSGNGVDVVAFIARKAGIPGADGAYLRQRRGRFTIDLIGDTDDRRRIDATAQVRKHRAALVEATMHALNEQRLEARVHLFHRQWPDSFIRRKPVPACLEPIGGRFENMAATKPAQPGPEGPIG